MRRRAARAVGHHDDDQIGEIDRPRIERPPRREEIIAIGQHGKPRGVHRDQSPGERAGQDGPHGRRGSGGCTGQEVGPPRRPINEQRGAHGDREPEGRRRMDNARDRQREERQPDPASKHGGRRAEADGKRKDARVHVTLERVRAGLRDVVPEREQRQQERDRPRRETQRASERDGRAGERQQRDDLHDEKQRWKIESRHTASTAEQTVLKLQRRLGLDERRVARKECRRSGLQDGRGIERLVRHPVAIPAGVRRGEEQEKRSDAKNARGPHASAISCCRRRIPRRSPP